MVKRKPLLIFQDSKFKIHGSMGNLHGFNMVSTLLSVPSKYHILDMVPPWRYEQKEVPPDIIPCSIQAKVPKPFEPIRVADSRRENIMPYHNWAAFFTVRSHL